LGHERNARWPKMRRITKYIACAAHKYLVIQKSVLLEKESIFEKSMAPTARDPSLILVCVWIMGTSGQRSDVL
jgi:hypothetical protein